MRTTTLIINKKRINTKEKKMYIQFMHHICDQATKIMQAHFGNIDQKIKVDKTIVTIVDEKINTLVIDEVKKNFPTHGILGEEESYNLGQEYMWICDPLDGTWAYAHQVATFCFSLALTKNGIPIAAIVSDISAGITLCDEDENLNAQKNNSINNLKINTDDPRTQMWGYYSWPTAPYAKPAIAKLETQLGMLYCGYSCVQGGMLVARGLLSGMVFTGKTAHDVAAIAYFVKRAGGIVTDVFGNEQRYDQPVKGAILAAPKTHAIFVDAFK